MQASMFNHCSRSRQPKPFVLRRLATATEL